MDEKSFDAKRIAEGYAKRPWLHRGVMEQLKKDCHIEMLESGLDVGCGAGLSTKALRLICRKVTGTDIAPSMIDVCRQLYDDPTYTFYVAGAEETSIPAEPYDILTAAGVVNWVDREKFLQNASQVLRENGLIVIYDFWITDRMQENAAYTDWYQNEYLRRFPKPYRKENVWQQDDLTADFVMEQQVNYELTYDFFLDDFVDFMMIQSNVNERIRRDEITAEEVKNWMAESLAPIFAGEKRTLIFTGYSWYIRKKESDCGCV